jgi:hypothetical protein
MTATVKIDTGRQRSVGSVAQFLSGHGTDAMARTE